MIELSDGKGPIKKVEIQWSQTVVEIKEKLSKIIYKDATEIQLYNGDTYLDNNAPIPTGVTRLMYKEVERNDDKILKVTTRTCRLPKLFQVSGQRLVGELKEDLVRIDNTGNNIVLFNQRGDQLNDNTAIEDITDDEIKICYEKDKHPKLSVSDLLPNKPSSQLTCDINNKISVLKENICNTLNVDFNNLVLFSETEFLHDDTLLIDYPIVNGDNIFYLELINNGDIPEWKLFKQGQFAKIYKGLNRRTNKQIVLKRYDLKKQKVEDIKPLKYEIITFLKLRDSDHTRFVQVECMFVDNEHFYIGMEFMEGNSLKNRIPIVDTTTIIRYLKQILEGLIFLHEMKIIYRNLKCSCVLFDGNDNIKLCNFRFSKYLQGNTDNQMNEGIKASRPIQYNWSAPEMLNGEDYGIKVDTWSVGATLIEVVTGRIPFQGLSNTEVQSRIINTRTIEYERPEGLDPSLMNIIDRCIRRQPIDQRPTAKQLLEEISCNAVPERGLS